MQEACFIIPAWNGMANSYVTAKMQFLRASDHPGGVVELEHNHGVDAWPASTAHMA